MSSIYSQKKTAKKNEGLLESTVTNFVTLTWDISRSFVTSFYHGLYRILFCSVLNKKAYIFGFALLFISTSIAITYYEVPITVMRLLKIGSENPTQTYQLVQLALMGLSVVLFIIICGGRWLRRRKSVEDKFSYLGFKRGENIISLKKEISRNDGQTQWFFKNMGFSTEDFKKQGSRIEHAFNIVITDIDTPTTKEEIVITFGHGNIPSFVRYGFFYGSAKANQFGFGHQGPAPLFSDWNSVIHMLVGGETGGGKSSFLRQLITRTLATKQKVELALIDLKDGLEFDLFRGCPSVNIGENLHQAHQILSEINQKMTARSQLFKQLQVVNLKEYNHKAKEKLSHIVVIIDECAELFAAKGNDTHEKSLITQSKNLIQRISRLARATGIHLVLATQRPDVGVIDGQTRVNLGTQICFRTSSDRASIMVLGHGKASKLSSISGRAIFKQGSFETEIQIPYLEAHEVKPTLKNAGLSFSSGLALKQPELVSRQRMFTVSMPSKDS